MEKKKILCLIPTIGDTKDIKRITLLLNNFLTLKVVGFDRNSFIARKPQFDVEIIASIEDRKYFSRLLKMISVTFKLRRLIKENSVIYALNPDLAMWSYFASIGLQRRLIIDLADIREIQVSDSFFGVIYRFLDKYVTNRCELLVVTSESFISDYYNKRLNVFDKKYFVLENKVDYKIEVNHNVKNINNLIVIGYFGVIRDKWTLYLLTTLVKKFPERFRVLIAGVCVLKGVDLFQLSKDDCNITYFGPYKSPEDLEYLYGQIDVLALFYPDYNSSKNWFNAKKICRSNRFYEGLYFNKPFISFDFCEDGKIVKFNNIGMTLKNYDIEDSLLEIEKYLNIVNIEKWKNNIREIPESMYLINEQGEEFARVISDLCN